VGPLTGGSPGPARPTGGPSRERPVAARRTRRPQRGFTLIELLVALLVAAVIIGMVTVSGTPSPERALRFDAERLAQLLSLAREEAQVRGSPIRFESDSEGFRFMIYRDRQWRPITDDGDLRARAWGTETRLLVDRPDGRRSLDFGRDMVEAPYRVRLQRPGATVTIVANGLGSFEVLE
jgi:general secretion pathway protein H